MTEQLAVLGRPIAHSRSPEIHQLFAAQAGMDITYDRLLVPEGKFRQTALGFLETGKGCNITLPCKHDAFLLADELSPGAEQAQAVNTLSKTPGGQLRGDNTDGPGLVNDLVRNLGWEIAGRRVLVLGAGGAVSGVLPDLIAAGPTVLHVSNRTHEKAVALVTRQREPLAQAVALNDLNETYDLIINGTSAGLANDSFEVQTGELQKLLTADSQCYDMIYGAAETPFLKWCRTQADCQTADGLGMLVEQAALAFHIWFGVKADTRPVVEKLKDSQQ